MFSNLFQKYNEIKARREDGESGFTLIELLVVVVIIGILVAIAIPLYLNYTDGAKSDSVQSDIRNMVTSIQQCYSDNNQALPTTFEASAAPAFSDAPCATKDPITISGGTKTMAYTTSGSGYTITAVDTSGNTFTYLSSSGKTTEVKAT